MMTTLAMVHSTAEYCVPVWCRSAHTCLINPTINNALQTVTGCLRPTPADNLPTLTGIQPVGASSHWSHTVSSTPCYGAWTSSPLSFHPPIVCKHTAPKTETPICTCHTTAHQLIWQQQYTCGAVGGLPMECGVDRQPQKTLHFHH